MNFKSIKLAGNLNTIVVLTFVVTILLSSPLVNTFQIDPDEGLELSKAMLVEEGYTLYSQIWNDQPPLFTNILAMIIGVFGNSLLAARLVTLAFSGLLIWTIFKIMETFGNLGMAVISALLLLLTEPFLHISFAVMRGLPAITLAAVSVLGMMLWHKSGKSEQLVISAVALALSVATKLFTLIVAPILFLGVLISDWNKPTKQKAFVGNYKASTIWVGVFVVSSGLVFLYFVGAENILQLVLPHFEATSTEGFEFAGIVFSPVILVLAGLGSVLIVRERNWVMLYPVAWMLFAYILLVNYYPAWYHQKLLFSVPAAMVAAYPIHFAYVSLREILQRQAGQKLAEKGKYFILGGLIMVLALLLNNLRLQNSEQPPSQASSIGNIRNEWNDKQTRNLQLVERFAADSEWMLTDLPIYAFRAGILTPPNTVVLSKKRILTGNLTEDELIQTVADYQPDQVLLGRFEFPDLVDYLGEAYSVVSCEGSGIKLFVSNALLEKAGPLPECD